MRKKEPPVELVLRRKGWVSACPFMWRDLPKFKHAFLIFLLQGKTAPAQSPPPQKAIQASPSHPFKYQNICNAQMCDSARLLRSSPGTVLGFTWPYGPSDGDGLSPWGLCFGIRKVGYNFDNQTNIGQLLVPPLHAPTWKCTLCLQTSFSLFFLLCCCRKRLMKHSPQMYGLIM